MSSVNITIKSFVIIFLAFSQVSDATVNIREPETTNWKSNEEHDDKQVNDDNEALQLWNGFRYRCPLPFGTFAHETDCKKFYVCVLGKSKQMSCPSLYHFDVIRRVCLPVLVALCFKDKDRNTREPDTASISTTTAKDSKFSCPGMLGSFAHEEDCSKYYYCAMYIPVERSCGNGELFDGVKNKCKPAKDVHCGNRRKPGDTDTTPATLPPTEPLTTPEPTVSKTPSPTPESEVETTTELRTKATAPPETDCDKDDLDCLIEGEGDPDEWFTCKEPVGSYPHPTSKKMFIFCLNWKPSVKKCGQDLVFSKILSTCVSPNREDEEAD